MNVLSAPVLQLYPAGAAVGPIVGAAVVGARVGARVGETAGWRVCSSRRPCTSNASCIASADPGSSARGDSELIRGMECPVIVRPSARTVGATANPEPRPDETYRSRTPQRHIAQLRGVLVTVVKVESTNGTGVGCVIRGPTSAGYSPRFAAGWVRGASLTQAEGAHSRWESEMSHDLAACLF